MILDIHGLPIDPIWAAEFRGFFLGEGSLEIGQISHTYKSKGHTYTNLQLRPRARILQRDDNRVALEAIHARLGGHITKHGAKKMVSPGNGKTYFSKATIAWYVVSGEGVQRVLDLLKGGFLPHTKLDEIAILEEYLAMRPRPGQKYTDEMRAHAWSLKDKIIQSRVYRESI